MLPADGGERFNRLIHEKSPYLLQHARNPVDWHPWGPDAFRQARMQDKPVFVSVGYSACHWCHVMERESFEREDVAELLNQDFISVKVDREERPDVDEIYMAATQLLTGRGGWPNSVWLTPDGRPWFAGTYFPREDTNGRAGFKTILKRLSRLWQTRRQDVEASADRFAEAIRQLNSPRPPDAAVPLGRQLIAQAVEDLRRGFDETHGGFGGAPKFPPHAALRLLIHEYRRTKDERLSHMITRTLDAMARGGIHDHLGGGFHRYATDAAWLVPHFEKMLCDNAQLARAYVDAYLLTGNAEYRRVAIEAAEWVLREMTAAAGGFASALDADSEGEEGKYYLWTYPEVLEVAGSEDGELFGRIYGLEKGGNYRDEASGRRPATNIVYLPRPVEVSAKLEGIDPGDLRRRLGQASQKLLARRDKRVRPHLDDKVVTAWNGLMIGALAYAGRCLEQPGYVAAAERAARFVLTRMQENGRLLRTYRDGSARLNAYLDDYAFLAEAMLELHEATGRDRWLDEAGRLIRTLTEHHADKAAGGFFFTSDDHEELLARSKSCFDAAIPSGNGVAARVLVRLAALTGEDGHLEVARATFQAFGPFMQQAPQGTATLLEALAAYLDQAEGAAAGSAQPGDGTASAGQGPVTVAVRAAKRQVPAGGTLQLSLQVGIEKGWHINSAHPLERHLVPTSVALARGTPAALGDVAYPQGRKVKFAFSDEPLAVYEGAVSIGLAVKIAETATPGPATLTLHVRTQACDDRSCQAPATHRLAVPVEIAPARGP